MSVACWVSPRERSTWEGRDLKHGNGKLTWKKAGRDCSRASHELRRQAWGRSLDAGSPLPMRLAEGLEIPRQNWDAAASGGRPWAIPSHWRRKIASQRATVMTSREVSPSPGESTLPSPTPTLPCRCGPAKWGTRVRWGVTLEKEN